MSNYRNIKTSNGWRRMEVTRNYRFVRNHHLNNGENVGVAEVTYFDGEPNYFIDVTLHDVHKYEEDMDPRIQFDNKVRCMELDLTCRPMVLNYPADFEFHEAAIEQPEEEYV